MSWREGPNSSGRTYHPPIEVGALSAPIPGTKGVPPFTQESGEGRLFPNDCQSLDSVLAEWTTTPESCWLGIWEGLGSFGYPRSMSFAQPEDAEVMRMGVELVEIAERVGNASRLEHPGQGLVREHRD
jgi:hypothetical protein